MVITFEVEEEKLCDTAEKVMVCFWNDHLNAHVGF